ncbi:MAG: RNA methyltransferase [Alphaproteobacteria bacterium]|nr:RNA methyltransferase [Alphaproteobacteria bacterium]
MKPARGYFGIGAEGVSKPMNLGALMRTANAFGASFTFSVAASRNIRLAYKADTSKTFEHVPYYEWDAIEDVRLPAGCQLVGIELADDAVDLPSFRHPPSAAYVLGREKGDLSPEMLARCSHVVRIPTRFCINVSLAGALVMYDRALCLGGYPARPVMPGGPPPELTRPLKAK